MIFSRKKNTDNTEGETGAVATPQQPATPPQTPPPSPAPAAPTAQQQTAGTPPVQAQQPPAATQQAQQGQPEQAQRILSAKMFAASFGEIVSVLMRAPHYKNQLLPDLEWLVLPPLINNQFVLAELPKDGIPSPVGVALWARVSPQVDQKLMTAAERIPRLAAEDWTSGDIFWLIDTVGPQQVVTGMVQNLHTTIFKGQPVKYRSVGEDGKITIKAQKAGG